MTNFCRQKKMCLNRTQIRRSEKGEPMKYELTQDEFNHLERCRALSPEFQAALNQQMNALYDLQIKVLKDALEQERPSA